MFGRLYESTYTGSLVGAGSVVFAVWGYVIAHMKPPEFDVELNPRLLAFILGDTNENVNNAINRLCAVDPESRTKVAEGRRLLKKGEYLYHVVNGELYARLHSNSARKMIWREQKARQREKNGIEGPAAVEEVEEKRPELPTVEDLAAADQEEQLRVKQVELLQPEQDKRAMTQVELVYDAYPKKVGKPDALRSIKKALSKVTYDYLLERTTRYAELVRRVGTDHRYIPNPATWFNQERFNDDIEAGVGITTRTIVCSYGEKDEIAGVVTPKSVDVDVRFMPDGSVDMDSIPAEPYDLRIAVQERLSELGLW